MTSTARTTTMSMICAAVVTAQFVAARATRDALFLTTFPITTLPTLVIATSICSLLCVAVYARLARRIAPAILVPTCFVASGLLFLLEWFLAAWARPTTAVVIYLHVSGAGPLLASGFWLIASERFDPRTAKVRFGQIAGAGTLGGLLGALLCERVASGLAVPSMLLFLAGLQLIAATLVRRLASGSPSPSMRLDDAATERVKAPARSGLRTIANVPALRSLAIVVLLGTTSAAMIDYLFQATAVDTFGRGDLLLRFFAVYYATASLVSFALQALASRLVLERFGLALTTSAPSIALVAGSVGSLLAPGFGSLLVARGSESVFRASWFRAGYELFYTPIPSAEKRAAKSVIDVGCDRLGDALGGGFVRLVLLMAPTAGPSAILPLAIIASVGAIIAASHLNRSYIRSLENNLVNWAGGINLARTEEGLTAMGLLTLRKKNTTKRPAVPALVVTQPTTRGGTRDQKLTGVTRWLRADDREEVVRILARQDPLPSELVPAAIALLSSDSLAEAASHALHRVAADNIPELTRALNTTENDHVIRRRLARVLSGCATQPVADALCVALDDTRFGVRFQAARSLATILEKNALLTIDRERIFQVVLREVGVSRPVWEGRRLLDAAVTECPSSAWPLDEFVRARADQGLAHVFTLLSLVLPRDPLRVAFRSLNGPDEYLRGTALEYLEGVLPPAIRLRLWPYLVPRPVERSAHRNEIFAELLRSSPSVTLKGIAFPPPRVAGLRAVTH